MSASKTSEKKQEKAVVPFDTALQKLNTMLTDAKLPIQELSQLMGFYFMLMTCDVQPTRSSIKVENHQNALVELTKKFLIQRVNWIPSVLVPNHSPANYTIRWMPKEEISVILQHFTHPTPHPMPLPALERPESAFSSSSSSSSFSSSVSSSSTYSSSSSSTTSSFIQCQKDKDVSEDKDLSEEDEHDEHEPPYTYLDLFPRPRTCEGGKNKIMWDLKMTAKIQDDLAKDVTGELKRDMDDQLSMLNDQLDEIKAIERQEKREKERQEKERQEKREKRSDKTSKSTNEQETQKGSQEKESQEKEARKRKYEGKVKGKGRKERVFKQVKWSTDKPKQLDPQLVPAGYKLVFITDQQWVRMSQFIQSFSGKIVRKSTDLLSKSMIRQLCLRTDFGNNPPPAYINVGDHVAFLSDRNKVEVGVVLKVNLSTCNLKMIPFGELALVHGSSLTLLSKF